MKMRQTGFTLIELMITVTIISVLVLIAYPSYKSQLVKTSRSAAQRELLELASTQEKIFLNSNAYTANITGAYTGTSAGGLGRASGMTTDAKYTLSLDITVAGPTYVLTASPVSGSTQVGDGAISISESGQRLWNGKSW